MSANQSFSRRKCQKGKYPSKFSKGGVHRIYSRYGVKSTTRGFLTSSQMEAVRLVITRAFRRKAKLIFRVFPNVSRTSKPVEVRMGKGKGGISRWVFKVSPGRIIFEVGVKESSRIGVSKVLHTAASKLPFKTKVLV